MANECNYLKDKYHEAKQTRLDTEYRFGYYNGNTLFSLREIAILAEMAEHDVWPDGHFGDDDCNVWSLFHRIYESKEES